MDISNNTILITGGSSGIGLELALQFRRLNNKVLICGRDSAKLKAAVNRDKKLVPLVCDLANETQTKDMLATIISDHPDLNVLINNAGVMHLHDVKGNSLAFTHQRQEIAVNISAPIQLCDALIPHLMKQRRAAIINVTSGLAYMPFAASPVYTATKAAIHSYSKSLRMALKNTSLEVFEVLPPMVETPMSEGLEMKGMPKMSTAELVNVITKQLYAGKYEIRPGMSAMMIRMYKFMPRVIEWRMAKMSPSILESMPRY